MQGRIIKNITLAVGFAALSFVYTTTASAEEEVIQLCPALADDATYTDNEDFKTMVAGKDGWIYRTDFDLKQDEYAFSEWSLTSFNRLKHAFKQNGTEVAVALLPTRGIVGYPYLLPPYDKSYDVNKANAGYAGMIDALKGIGIVTADSKDVGTVSGFFLKRDNHWTAVGAKYMAQKTAEAIKASPIYATLKKAEFETTSAPPAEPKNANDNFLEFIEEKCGKLPPVEKIPTIFTTSRKQTGDANAALLGDAEKPEIVLLGTSNSTEPEPSYGNFVGFLREYIGADVKNESVQGGSMRGAISNYILMGEYQKEKPKLIVWELSAHYGFEQKALFREIIPAIYGACSDQEALAISSGNVNPSETEILKDLGDKKLFSFNYYLVLELSDKGIRKVNVDFIHMGQKHDDDMEYKRTERNFPVNNGVYFAELKYGINEPLKSVNINTKNGKGTYKAKICKIP